MCGTKAHKNSIKKIRKHYNKLAKNPECSRPNSKKSLLVEWCTYKDFVC